MPFKAIIFDMDGTLINSVEDIADSMNIVLKNNNFPQHDVTCYINWIGDGLKNLVLSALPSNINKEEIIDKCLDEMKSSYSQRWMLKSHLYPGIPELLTELRKRKFKLAVLSNKTDSFTKTIAENMLSEWKFDVVMGYRDGYKRKPDPASAIEISKLLELLPDQIVYVGDSSTDMQTAVNAGMMPIGVSWGYRSADSLITSGAKKIIQHPFELINLL